MKIAHQTTATSGLERQVYIQRFARAVLGIDGISLDPTLAQTIFYELSRTPEATTKTRDQWGNWEWPFAEAQRAGRLYTPWLDEPLVVLRRHLMAEHPDWPWEPLWPEGRPFALCLTHDVDLVTQEPTLRTKARELSRLVRAGCGSRELVTRATLATLQLARSGRRGDDPLWHYEDWLKLEQNHGFRSTFYFFPSRLVRPALWDCTYSFDDPVRFAGRRMSVGTMMRTIAGAGWEIGLHGSYYSANVDGILRDERAQVEEVILAPVTSTRQHWLHYEVSTTPRLQAEAGLHCDSTQGFNRNIGFRAGTAFPYWCWDHQKETPLPVLELPQHIMDGALFTANALEYSVEMALKHCLQLMDRVEQVGGCLTLSWHPNYLNDSKWWLVYRTLLEEAAHRRAWGCSAGQLYAWWVQREDRIRTCPPQFT